MKTGKIRTFQGPGYKDKDFEIGPQGVLKEKDQDPWTNVRGNVTSNLQYCDNDYS